MVISTSFRRFIISSIFVLILLFCLYTLIPELYWSWVDWPFSDPVFSRFFGITCLAIAIIQIIILRAKEWNKIKIMIEFEIIWLFLVNIINIWSIFAINFSKTAFPGVIFDTALTIFYTIGFVYFYIRHKNAFELAES